MKLGEERRAMIFGVVADGGDGRAGVCAGVAVGVASGTVRGGDVSGRVGDSNGAAAVEGGWVGGAVLMVSSATARGDRMVAATVVDNAATSRGGVMCAC